MPHIFVITGGILSGLGKGTTAASIARLLKNNGKIVTIKFDGYLNVDPGTMNPIEHGEVFVLDDGTEVDMDFGHYERFLGIPTKGEWSITSGKIFQSIIEKERRGVFLGRTIQIFPHLVNEIIEHVEEIINKEQPDYLFIEIGGTVGDIENSWFIRAMKILKRKYKVEFIHLTYSPFLHNVEEYKTKPAQRDIALLRQLGIEPDIVILRSKDFVPERIKQKLAEQVDLEQKRIINGRDVSNVYEIPLMFEQQGLIKIIEQLIGKPIHTDLKKWRELIENMNNAKQTVTIAIAGKYTYLKDSYASVIEALKHAGANLGVKINIKWIETANVEDNIKQLLSDVQGVIVPGGFGKRGIEGKIKVIQYARTNNLPFLGICLGLQLAVVEFARNVCKLKDANSTEFEPKTKHNVIDLLDEQRNISQLGGTMRLGSYPAVLKKGTKTYELYGKQLVYERHRHRYEVNPEYHKILQKHGLVFSGMSPDNKLVEFIELPNHKFFIATQAHPELKSQLENPAPLFIGLVRAAIRN